MRLVMNSKPIVKHAGDGDWLNILGMKIKFLSTSKDTQNRHSSMLNTVPKGLGAPLHSHPWDETFYIIEGEIELTIGERQYHLFPGDYALVPANEIHAFKGLSDQDGLMILFESPSHSQAFFQEINDTVKLIPDDLGKMQSIGDKNQVKFHQ